MHTFTFNTTDLNSAITELRTTDKVLATDVRKLYNNIKDNKAESVYDLVHSNTVRKFKSDDTDEVLDTLEDILYSCLVVVKPLKFFKQMLKDIRGVLDRESDLDRKFILQPEETARKSRFGLESEVVVSISRLLNSPLDDTESYSSTKVLDSLESVVVEVFGLDMVSDDEVIAELMSAFQNCRRAVGYTSFILRDEHEIIDGVRDVVYPDEELMEDGIETIYQHFGFGDQLPTLKSFNSTKFDALESKAQEDIAKAYAEAKSDRKELNSHMV